MLFSSTTFIYLFLPLVLIVYYGLLWWSRKAQNVFLLIASLFFYAWGEPSFVLVMMGSIVINWLFGLLVDKFRDKKAIVRSLIAVDVALNLGLLFVFKYLTFSVGIINSVFSAGITLPAIALPIGISFFTFQAMSYVLDVYRQKGDVQKDILCVGLYISFFPQLIAGPIVRYETVAEEILHRKSTFHDFFDGFSRFVVGLSKKVLLANHFAFLADTAFTRSANGTLSVAYSWFGALAYTFQIFFDFSGYSDMAIGLGKMFGFHFLENFNYPYISKSISEFWRRWHISLGTWFRDYVYFPLGGSRVKKSRMILNLFVVWFLTGLWHGANFTFIVWGLMYFVLIALEKVTGFDKKGGKYLVIPKWLYTMVFVVLGWVLFRADNIGEALHYMGSMFGLNGNPLVDGLFIGYVKQNVVYLPIAIALSTPLFRVLNEKTRGNVIVAFIRAIVLIAVFGLSLVSLVSSTYNPFIYFNF